MRNETSMRALILDVANQHPSIRAVVLNGSRVNKNAVKDAFQDYDIVYYFDDEKAFNSRDWPTLFGEILIMQTLEDMVFDPPSPVEGLIYLMQFKEGNRIDLSLKHVDALRSDLKRDSLSRVWLDKDERVTHTLVEDDRSYHVKQPEGGVVDSCVNECFWVAFYVLKGVARLQLGYAQAHLNMMRTCLEGMLSWAVGLDHQFQVSTGKQGAYFNRWLRSDWLKRWHATWAKATPEAILQALEILLELFVEVSAYVAQGLDRHDPVRMYQEAYQVIRSKLEKLQAKHRS